MPAAMDLFGDGDAPTDELKINEQYAARFTHNRRRAELDALREKFGDAAPDNLDDDDETDSEEDETEDEDGEQVTADVDAALLRTLARIRNRDEGIYDSSKRIFDSEHEHVLSKAPKSESKSKEGGSKQKRMTLQDYQRQRVEDLIKTSADPAKALADATTNPARQAFLDGANGSGLPKSHVQEQEDLRKQVTAAFHDADAEAEDDDFFKPRGAGDEDDEEGDGKDSYRKYLLSAIESDELDKAVRDSLKDNSAYEAIAVREADADAVEEASGKKIQVKKEKGKKRKRKTKEEEDEDFLMNYVLNRGWVDAPSGSSSVSIKKRSVKREEAEDDHEDEDADASKFAYGRDWEAEAAELASEDSFDSRAEAFETAYNFRFESIADGSAPAAVQSFARANQLKDSVRREDDSRKKKREERKARKEAEKAEKMAELERFRSLQKEEIRDRVRRILKEAGAEEEEQFAHLDLDGDFDPDNHDRAMSTAFNQDYYAHGEGAQEDGDDDMDPAGEDADGKPVWDDDIDIGDILAQEEEYTNEAKSAKDKKLKKKEKKKLKNKQKALERAQVDDGEDDGAGDGEEMDLDDEGAGPSSSAVKLPEIDEEELKGLSKEERKQKAKEMVEQLHELDYEDMIGDMPTRFKYASVPKSNYGLTPVEILMADDKDLNEVVGLRMLQPYRKGGAAQKRPADLNRKLREFRSKLSAKAGGRREGSSKRDKVGGPDGEGKEKPKSKRMGKKERLKKKAAEASTEGGSGGTA